MSKKIYPNPFFWHIYWILFIYHLELITYENWRRGWIIYYKVIFTFCLSVRKSASQHGSLRRGTEWDINCITFKRNTARSKSHIYYQVTVYCAHFKSVQVSCSWCNRVNRDLTLLGQMVLANGAKKQGLGGHLSSKKKLCFTSAAGTFQNWFMPVSLKLSEQPVSVSSRFAVFCAIYWWPRQPASN